MKRYFLLLIVFAQIGKGYGQQFALYNTKTLFDAFENPSQKAFIADTTKKYAFNFFIPNINLGTEITGPAQITFKKLFYTGTLNSNDLALGGTNVNRFFVNENMYIAMFKVFKSAYINSEQGFSWQIKTDLRGAISNESLAILHDYRRFQNNLPYPNSLNNSWEGISYHQLSFTYRENYDKNLGIGVKLSYLSGIAYSLLTMNSSKITVDLPNKSYKVDLDGQYRTNFLYYDADKHTLIPGFKNPGLAISISANKKFHHGWFAIANLKDLGFIRWSNQPYTYTIDQTLEFITGSGAPAIKPDKKIQNELFNSPARGSFTTPINGKAELLINKNLDFYQPNLLLSKSLFNSSGNISFVNTFRQRAINLSLTPSYNLDKYFMLGGQFMIKSPNAEFYLGSDQLLKSYYTAKGLLTSNENIGKGNTAASFYMGFSMKFGTVKERWQNASYIPMDEKKVGFFKRMTKKIFKKKRFEGQQKPR